VAVRRRRVAVGDESRDPTVSASEKIARLLALLATQGMDTDEAAIKLDGVGFSARQISALLDVGPNYLNVARHRRKTSAKKSKGKNV
jgi:hypothetical protein